MANYTNTDCPLFGSEYCRKLNMDSCKSCTVTSSNAEGIKADIDAIESLLPEGGVSRFFTGSKCVLCKGEPNDADCYAMTDIGNPQPEREGRNALGLKTKLRVGSMLPLQFSCCSACRKRHAAAANREVIITLAAAIIMLALLNFVPTAEAIAYLGSAVPLLSFIAVVGGVWLICRATRRRRIKKYSELTCMDIFEVQGMEELRERGWFEIYPNKDMSRLVFSKEPLRRGLFTERQDSAEDNQII